ncbi:hypothetical protein A3219_21595 [Salmonella enterica]|nr:hypothetical protein A3219_21595 [Salmonella enterica]
MLIHLIPFNLNHFYALKQALFSFRIYSMKPLEDLNVFQHTSPERLVRMMVMMVVFKLNACHKNSDECLFI